MTFRQFARWSQERICDGNWGYLTAIACCEICSGIYKKTFWKREKEWQKINSEYGIEKDVVIPINAAIERMKNEK